MGKKKTFTVRLMTNKKFWLIIVHTRVLRCVYNANAILVLNNVKGIATCF